MSKRPPNKQATAINALLEQILASKGLDKKLRQYRAWTVWDDVVGPQIARHAQPLRIREAILEVRVENATWMQQLQLLKPKILKELNNKLDGEPLSDIYWKRGEVNKAQHAGTPSEKIPPNSSKEIPEEVLESLQQIEDQELRKIVKTVLSRDYGHS